MIPIHYKRPSVCLQGERRCSAVVWSRGSASAKSRDGTSPSQYSVVFTFVLSSAISDPVSPHPAGWFDTHPTWGSSRVRSSSSREGRQSSFWGAMALSGLF